VFDSNETSERLGWRMPRTTWGTVVAFSLLWLVFWVPFVAFLSVAAASIGKPWWPPIAFLGPVGIVLMVLNLRKYLPVQFDEQGRTERWWHPGAPW
jgi:hypothetical protein